MLPNLVCLVRQSSHGSNGDNRPKQKRQATEDVGGNNQVAKDGDGPSGWDRQGRGAEKSAQRIERSQDISQSKSQEGAPERSQNPRDQHRDLYQSPQEPAHHPKNAKGAQDFTCFGLPGRGRLFSRQPGGLPAGIRGLSELASDTPGTWGKRYCILEGCQNPTRLLCRAVGIGDSGTPSGVPANNAPVQWSFPAAAGSDAPATLLVAPKPSLMTNVPLPQPSPVRKRIPPNVNLMLLTPEHRMETAFLDQDPKVVRRLEELIAPGQGRKTGPQER